MKQISRVMVLVFALVATTNASATNLPFKYPAAGPYYVATTGSDSTGDGSAGNPVATIGKMRDLIRTNGVNRAMYQDVVVNVAAGTYDCTAPIQFGPSDSGCCGHKVVYQGNGSAGSAVLSAGVPVTGWSLDSGSVWKASVSPTLNFYTLYENGARADPARSPDRVVNASYPGSQAPYYHTVNNGSSLTQLEYNPSDFDPTGWTVADVHVRILPYGNDWLSDELQVSAINTTSHLLTLSQQAKFYTYQFVSGVSSVPSRYFVEGGRALVTQAGEFYLDRTAHVLYYWPRNTPIASQTIIAPASQECLQVFGAGETVRAHDLQFDGFTIANTDFAANYRNGYPWDYGTSAVLHPSPQPHVMDPAFDYFAELPASSVGSVHARNVDHVTFSRIHVTDAGMHGMYFDEYGQAITIKDTLVDHAGISGIKFGGRYPGEGCVLGNGTVDSVKVHDFGESATGATGIEFANSGGWTVQYMEIYNGPRKALWFYGDEGLGQMKASGWVCSRGNVADHILVHNVCGDSADTGAIGLTSFSSTGYTPYVIQDSFSQVIVQHIHADPTMINILTPNGVFMDDETWGAGIFTNVEVVDTDRNQFRANNSGNPILTNTSFMSDGTANPSFNPALMDTANIGVRPTFPY